MTIFFILMTYMFDQVVILQGEIRCLPLLRLNGLFAIFLQFFLGGGVGGGAEAHDKRGAV